MQGLLECPISKVRMRDPVLLLADGHTYERSSIERWLASSMISPMTNLPIQSRDLCTNWLVRALIDFTAADESEKCTPLPRRARNLNETLANVEPIEAETFKNAAVSPALLPFSAIADDAARRKLHAEWLEQAKTLPSHMQFVEKGFTQKAHDGIRSVRRNIGAKEFYSLAQIFSFAEILRTVGYTAHQEIRNKRIERGFYVACTIVQDVTATDCVFVNCIVSCKNKSGCLALNCVVTFPTIFRDCMFITEAQDV